MLKRYLSAILLVATAAFALAGCSTVQSGTSTPAPKKTYMWKVSSAHRMAYIVGDTQMLTKKDYPLPEVVTQAFAKSGTVFFEQNPGFDKRKMAMTMMKLGRLPAGHQLSDKLDADQLATVKKAASNVGFPFARLEHLRPWMAGFMLKGMYIRKLGIDPSEQLTMHFYHEAVQRKMTVVPFEKVSTVFKEITALSQAGQVGWLMMQAKAVNKTTAHPEKRKHKMQAWLEGDVEPLAQAMRKWHGKFPQSYRALASSRSRRWVKTLEGYLAKSGKPLFVVMGSGHLAGPDNMLELLSQDGYKVTQL
jgi:uncharacterized protein YbaP (TraB family)